jgi:3'5'-cyclic nucleotide phosphodiesterase/Adenylate and Guanylate cyclase catalytic domain
VLSHITDPFHHLLNFQVNTASRMESSSHPNKIQVSQKTAELVVEAGKGHWLTSRKDQVNAKGKGLLQTYWLDTKRSKASGSVISSLAVLGADVEDYGSTKDDERRSEQERNPFFAADEVSEERLQRLIDWNVELFEDLLRPIVLKRHGRHTRNTFNHPDVNEIVFPDGSSVRSQVVAAVTMPEFQPSTVATREVDLDPDVVSQLRMYITTVANLYRNNNAFHNFEHASHVIMSTVKLLQGIATRDMKKKVTSNQKEYYDYTYGISTDALTKFAIVFSALIHDLDHDGVSNWQLVKEQHPIAVTYDGLSPMEQHSFTLAFELLMEDSYSKLRAALYDTQEEFDRFFQLCINCVIATDIFDKDLKSFREDRWKKVFAASEPTSMTDDEIWHCKATICIEYIIQASDVAHTMQHWHVYQSWNKRLFMEMYAAYSSGRADKNPLAGWFDGELWFFDNYVIPLAKKLKECEIFGVDCDQLLDYATQNRMEWLHKGNNIVKSWKEELEGNGNHRFWGSGRNR